MKVKLKYDYILEDKTKDDSIPMTPSFFLKDNVYEVIHIFRHKAFRNADAFVVMNEHGDVIALGEGVCEVQDES